MKGRKGEKKMGKILSSNCSMGHEEIEIQGDVISKHFLYYDEMSPILNLLGYTDGVYKIPKELREEFGIEECCIPKYGNSIKKLDETKFIMIIGLSEYYEHITKHYDCCNNCEEEKVCCDCCTELGNNKEIKHTLLFTKIIDNGKETLYEVEEIFG